MDYGEASGLRISLTLTVVSGVLRNWACPGGHLDKETDMVIQRVDTNEVTIYGTDEELQSLLTAAKAQSIGTKKELVVSELVLDVAYDIEVPKE